MLHGKDDKARSKKDKGKRPKVANAERDCHRFFGKHGLSTKIPIQKETVVLGAQTYDMDYITIRDWLRYLLATAPCLVAGGEESLEVQLESFWCAYRWVHPTHEVFSSSATEKLRRTIPVILFGDEGKGPKRGNYLVQTFETPMGLWNCEDFKCSCHDELSDYPQEYIPDCYGDPHPDSDPHLRAALKAATNNTGHVYLKRHILFGIQDVVYKAAPASNRHSVCFL